MKHFLSIILLFSSVLTFAQDLKKDLLQMNQYLNNLPSFSMEVSYSVTDSIKEEGMVSVYKNNDGLFYKIEHASIVVNENNTLIIDDKNRTIIYSINEIKKKKEKFDVQKKILKGLDTLIANVDSIYYTLNNTRKTYYLRMENNYFNLMEIEFEGNVIDLVTYYYNPKFVEEKTGLKAINKLKIKENPPFESKFLQTDFYIHLVNGEYQPTEEFKNYLLIYNESTDAYFE